MPDMDWAEEALCKGKHYDFWYPPLEASNVSQYTFVAKAVCDRCPVWLDCLQISKDETWGTWGGLTPQERRSMISHGGSNLRPHGTIARYRQGCECYTCKQGNAKYLKPLDMKYIPNAGEDFDPPTIKFLVGKMIS